MKILVTGAGGFVGEYLVRELMSRKHDIVAIGLHTSAFLKKNNIPMYKANILDFEAIKLCLKKERPDGIIHLAAQSNVQASWDKPTLTVDVNVNGTINVLKAIAEVYPQTRFLNIGSSDEYGITAKVGKPLTEDMVCLPQNPYSISKLCAEQMVLQLGKKYNVNVIHVRPFNHFGPGQQIGFVISDFSSQIANIEKGKIEPVLRVGDLSSCRDFTFVKDVVRAYVLLIESNRAVGVYNICSGKAQSIEGILQKLVGLSNLNIQIKKDEKKFRPVEVPFFVGCTDKLKSVINWQIEDDFETNLAKTLVWWRKQL